MHDAILKLPEVKARTGVGRSFIYKGMRAGTFPTPIQLGVRSVGWLEADVCRWIADRIAASRGGAK
jgi:prophage regulatory protein